MRERRVKSMTPQISESGLNMHRLLKKPSPAMIVACLALFVASAGTSIAARHYLITSTKQIKPSVLKKLKGAKGPKGSKGAIGAIGATGAAGAAGAQGPGGVVTTAVFNGGGGGDIAGSSLVYVFTGATATVTTTASQRLTGAAEMPLGSLGVSASGQGFDYGLCYQPSTGGTITNFTTSFSSSRVYLDKRTFAAAASVLPGAGTWTVGFCVHNSFSIPIDEVDWVNGWVQVTN